MKVLLVFGTRPEAIKMAPVVKALQADKSFQTVVAVTAQHREMLDQVLSVFEITPDFDLDLMGKGQDLYDITTKVLLGLRDVYRQVTPDVVLVHGDTTTTFAASLAAFYEKIPVGHVEAGLRTHDIYSPWPEEVNRQLTSRITKWHFSPTEKNQENLLAEAVDPSTITVTGNTVIDALLYMVSKLQDDLQFRSSVIAQLLQAGLSNTVVDRLENSRVVLITGHRRENFGEGFQNICKSLASLADHNEDVDFIYPVHLNPNVLVPVGQLLSGRKNVHLIKPLSYEAFVHLMQSSYLILSDSGGVQEEAPSLGKPVLVMRDTTERPEAVDAGTVKLVGTNVDLICSQTQQLLDDPELYKAMSRAHNPYGDGNASGRIVEFLRSHK